MATNIGDIVVLSNGLNLKLVLEDIKNYFKTIDVDTGKNVTTDINIEELDKFHVGLLTWGYGSEKHKIVEIIKKDVEEGINMKKFDIKKHWEDFKQGKIAVNCRTEDLAIEFLKYCHNKGLKWGSGASLLELNYWHNYESKMCYSYHNGMTKENINYYQEDKYIITKFSGLDINYIGKRVKIINFDGWRKDFKGDYSRTDKYIGAIGKIEKVREFDHKFMIQYDDNELQEIDIENSRLYFRHENIEFLDEDTYEHIKKPKPPLGVMPKQIFELQRVQELCRALYDRSIFEEVDYNLMIKWSEELNDRLYGLKGDCEFDLLGNL